VRAKRAAAHGGIDSAEHITDIFTLSREERLVAPKPKPAPVPSPAPERPPSYGPKELQQLLHMLGGDIAFRCTACPQAVVKGENLKAHRKGKGCQAVQMFAAAAGAAATHVADPVQQAVAARLGEIPVFNAPKAATAVLDAATQRAAASMGVSAAPARVSTAFAVPPSKPQRRTTKKTIRNQIARASARAQARAEAKAAATTEEAAEVAEAKEAAEAKEKRAARVAARTVRVKVQTTKAAAKRRATKRALWHLQWMHSLHRAVCNRERKWGDVDDSTTLDQLIE
jgi:DNA polymerase III gamma/tau subunit